MTPERQAYIDAYWSKDIEWAGERLIKHGSVGMMVVVHTPANNVVVYPDASNISKQEFYDFVRIIAVAHEAFAVAIISEAWMLEGAAALAAKQGRGPMPTESQNRVEVLSTAMTYRDDESGQLGHRLSIRPIARDTNGKPIGLLTEIDDGGGKGLVGEFWNLIPPRKPTSREQRVAKQLLARSRSGLDLHFMTPAGNA
jgi:hypothetical protein